MITKNVFYDDYLCVETKSFSRAYKEARHSSCLRQEKAFDEEPTTLIRAGCCDHGGHNDDDYQEKFRSPPEESQFQRINCSPELKKGD